MLKKEIIWRQILHQAFAQKKYQFTQKELADQLGFSLSTVNNALTVPRRAAAIVVGGRGFRVSNKEKFLLLWATHRNLSKDIIWRGRVEADSVQTIEGRLPPGVMFAAYSAYVRQYQTAPADYDMVYVYVKPSDLPALKQRFPAAPGAPNIVGLKADPGLEQYGNFPPAVQLFVDLWNLPQWYAQDFLNDLKKRLNL